MIVTDKNKIAYSLGKSKFLRKLAEYYTLAPSVILIRAAESELLSALPMERPILDLCCGDGFFCSLLFPDGVEVGCDFSLPTLRLASRLGQYHLIVCSDITKGLPFKDQCFQTVVSNSSLEHVKDIENTLREISRVIKQGGRLYTTFASYYAYEWWPCGKKALHNYLRFQPIYNYFPHKEWKRRMDEVGLHVIKHHYYLSKRVTHLLLWLDYHFSHIYLTFDKTIYRFLIHGMRAIPKLLLEEFWRKLFSRVKICQEKIGGGILIIAERKK